jgi:Undecaprenyl-phosphate galactose phosphotransferase WbaP
MRISKPKLISIKHYHLQMGALMIFADIVAFGMVKGVLFLLNLSFPNSFRDFGGEVFMVFVLLCMMLMVYSRLYPGSGINPADEIKLVVERTSIGLVLGFIILLFIHPTWEPDPWPLIVLWGVMPVAILLMRWSIRIQAGRWGIWGEPVVVVGNRERVTHLVKYFQQRRRLGFAPVLAVVPDQDADSLELPIPVISLSNLLSRETGKAFREEIRTALVDIEKAPEIIRQDTQMVFSGLFRQIILFVDVDWLEGASLHVQDFEGLLGVEARKNFLSAPNKLLKRMMDIVLAALIGIVSSPVLMVAALLIRWDSAGSVFYSQNRIGRKGEPIRIYKFRTMVHNADLVLDEYMIQNPSARAEWDQTQKLKEDPRVTRPGKWLRKLSIDELPQLINVLKGEMSLVGPRPMMAEQECLHHGIASYYGVPPGLTGLWQVSGRNQTTFNERARYDVYYVRNWSIWLDIYILLRTVWVVLSRDGAY